MAWSRDRSSTPAARGVLVQVAAVQAVLETAGCRAYCWRKAGSAIVVGLVLQDGLVDGETDAGWGGEPAQVVAGGFRCEERVGSGWGRWTRRWTQHAGRLGLAPMKPSAVIRGGGRVGLMDSPLGGASGPADESWC